MDIPSELLSYRPQLRKFLRGFLDNRSKKYTVVGAWGPDAIKRLTAFILGGKGVRGVLALFAYNAFSKKKNTNDALPLAAALELFHAAFLIQDDVMDQDEIRHGKPTIYMQYKNTGLSAREGESLAMNVAGLAISCGYDVFSQNRDAAKILGFVSQELAPVMIAQMHDIVPGDNLTVEDILRTYRFKTARYTFSLPLSAGARLAETPLETAHQLEKLGEHIGLLFQIRDDELGASGDEEKTGKPIGTDAREKRQTLATVVGNLDAIKQDYTKRAQGIIGALPISHADKKILRDILAFVSTRDR